MILNTKNHIQRVHKIKKRNKCEGLSSENPNESYT